MKNFPKKQRLTTERLSLANVLNAVLRLGNLAMLLTVGNLGGELGHTRDD